VTWPASVNKLNDVVLRKFGTTVTYKPRSGASVSLAANIDDGAQPEGKSPGVSVSAFVRASAFASPPVQGEEITIGTKLYKIVDIDADAHGALDLKLKFHRDVT